MTEATPLAAGYTRKPPIPREDYLRLVGQDLGVTEWTLVDQPRIDAFADVTGTASTSMSIRRGPLRRRSAVLSPMVS